MFKEFAPINNVTMERDIGFRDWELIIESNLSE